MLDACHVEGEVLPFTEGQGLADDPAATTTEEPQSSAPSSPSTSRPLTPRGSFVQHQRSETTNLGTPTRFDKPSTPSLNLDDSDSADVQRLPREELAIAEGLQSLADGISGSAVLTQRQNAMQIAHDPVVCDSGAQQLDTVLKENLRDIKGTHISCDRARREQSKRRSARAYCDARAKPGEDWLGEKFRESMVGRRQLLRRTV